MELCNHEHQSILIPFITFKRSPIPIILIPPPPHNPMQPLFLLFLWICLFQTSHGTQSCNMWLLVTSFFHTAAFSRSIPPAPRGRAPFFLPARQCPAPGLCSISFVPPPAAVRWGRANRISPSLRLAAPLESTSSRGNDTHRYIYLSNFVAKCLGICPHP